MKSIFLAIIILAIMGCVCPPAEHYTLNIDPQADETLQQSAISAINAWEEKLGKNVMFDVRIADCNGNDHEICVHFESLVDIRKQNTSNEIIIGYTTYYFGRDSADVYIPNDWDNKLVEDITHELGHAMGMNHTQAGTVMCWNASCASDGPSCGDIVQWTTMRGLSPFTVECPNGGSFRYEH